MSAKKKTANSRGAIAFRQFKKNKLAVIGSIVFIIIVLACLFGDYLTPYDYAKQDIPNKFAPLSWEHPFGTDQFGRDQLTRMLVGGRISLYVGTLACILGTVVGAVCGCSAAFFGGKIEQIIMRCMEILQSIPSVLLSAAIAVALGDGLWVCIVAIGVGNIASMTRIVHASALTISGQDYMEASQAIGCSTGRKIFKHVLPNTLPTIIVRFAMTYSHSVTAIASLAFLGLGVKAPNPEWGAILNAGKPFIRAYPEGVILPGLVIAITLMCVNFIGDGLRDALDPRMKR